ncbi:hypothetical protein [Enterobacter hormaechei]|uniref:hypothetical protein n=1 Tax=Enterobacter hormaechei TaxID=158836 RepID=UPI001E5E0FDD|nr:hypothetical protein [Enterobacter hormaechei]
MTLTKEWLLTTIAELVEERDATPGSVNEDAAMALAAMKRALASLEAEPVCVIDQSNLDYLKSGSDADVWPASRTEMGDVLLYRTAPPAPVSVPAAMEMDDDFDSAFEHGKAVGWNAYRAAMLQSFGNSEQLNSPVIQDGSEDTKRLDWLDAQNKRLNEYYWTTYGWKFDANFQRNAMMLNDSNYPVMTVRQAIDEAIAAAPQQEVK